jgi:hypothetical protein
LIAVNTRWSCPGIILLPLLVFFSNILFALDPGAAELESLFRLPTGGKIAGRPLEDRDGNLLAASEDRYLYRIDRHGKVLSRSDLPGLPVGFNALGVDGTVYVALRSGLSAINPAGGQLWRYRFSAPLVADPVVSADGRVFCVDASGIFTALDHRGDVLWQETLNSGSGGQPIIDSRGVVIVADGSGFLNAWLPWGRFLWRFRLAGHQTAICAGNSAMYAASAEGTIAKVSHQGTLLWSSRLESRTLFLVENTAGIAALDSSGNLTLLNHDGDIQMQPLRAVSRPAALFLLQGGFAAIGKGGDVSIFSKSGGPAENGSIPSPIETAALSSAGGIIAGGEDWNLYALKTEPRDPSGWSGPGGEPGNRWNRRFIGSVSPRETWKEEPDYLLLSALMESGGREGRETALTIIRKVLAESGPGNRRYPPYYGDFTRMIATEAFDRPLLQGGRVINDYPDLREKALELLSREASYASLHTLRLAASQEWFSDNRAAAIRGLGRIGSDPDGKSSRTIAGILLVQNTIETSPDFTRTAMKALHEILLYNGSAPDRALYETAIEVYRRSTDRESREWALRILRFGT